MNGPLLALAAVAAGVVSATSPCVLPVLPGYLAAVSATDDSGHGKSNARTIGALGFIAGFTAVFTLLGATASAIGGLLFEQLDALLRVAGVVLIVFGLQTAGIFHFLALAGERRPVELHRVGRGPRRAAALGAAFALGWTPCIGPILATILTKAAADQSLTEGMVLLLLYSAGLGLPFLALAIWFEKSHRLRNWLQRRAAMLQRVSGAVMVVVGIGYLTATWATVFTGLQGWLARTGWPPI
ncbi:MAG TPA: cytochrome c biogenesis CcdA family protein [Ilumatobacteraceae bacterium]|nr:cytochrome c biogenesis CcdA family protein [Ilumatobacteraceae bacterium]